MNVSKGVIAKKAELKQAFGTEDEKEIITQILKRGEIQVSGKERQHQNEKLFKDIANIVAEKCVDPETNRPITAALIERAMRDLHYNVKENRTAKQQALEVIKFLEGKIPIARAKMRLKLVIPIAVAKDVKEYLTGSIKKIEKEETDEQSLTMVKKKKKTQNQMKEKNEKEKNTQRRGREDIHGIFFFFVSDLPD
jgi:ribosome maturation protein SDO1